MAVTAQLVKELREMTGAGMMDCKKALVETDGNIDKAVEVLREKGLSKAAKKAGRMADAVIEANQGESFDEGAEAEEAPAEEAEETAEAEDAEDAE